MLYERDALKNAIDANDNELACDLIVAMSSSLLDALTSAALKNNHTIVRKLLELTTVNCSGHLMEDLLRRGLIDMAKFFIDSGRHWGSAGVQYAEYQTHK